jgi:hypothetical protein
LEVGPPPAQLFAAVDGMARRAARARQPGRQRVHREPRELGFMAQGSRSLRGASRVLPNCVTGNSLAAVIAVIGHSSHCYPLQGLPDTKRASLAREPSGGALTRLVPRGQMADSPARWPSRQPRELGCSGLSCRHRRSVDAGDAATSSPDS